MKVQTALSVERIVSGPENVSFRRSNEAGGGRESRSSTTSNLGAAGLASLVRSSTTLAAAPAKLDASGRLLNFVELRTLSITDRRRWVLPDPAAPMNMVPGLAGSVRLASATATGSGRLDGFKRIICDNNSGGVRGRCPEYLSALRDPSLSKTT